MTDKGLNALLNLKRLDELSVQGSSDAGVSVISRLKSLRILYIGSITLTDSGVEKLVALDRLEYLDLDCAHLVSDAAVTQFKSERPEVDVKFHR